MLLYRIILVGILGLHVFSCSDIEFWGNIPEEQTGTLSRAIPTPVFDWENIDWMPTPLG